MQPAFDVPRMHPSRTRGRGSIVVGNPYVRLGDKDSVVAKGEEKYKETEAHRNNEWWVKNLDKLSSVLSAGAFIVALFMTFYERTRDSRIEIWRENLIVVNSTLSVKTEAVSSAFEGLEDALQDFCLPDDSDQPQLHFESRKWSESGYTGSAFIQPAGEFNPWLVLLWIFAVSALFQSARGWGWGNIVYNPHRPDFWRWLEYALTAPFQIILIGTSVFINERAQVMNMAGLQAALVLLGYMNEKRIDSFYKRAIKKAGELSAPAGTKMWKLWIQTLFCWVFFIIIWYTIIARFELQKKNISDCEYDVKMPGEVNFIVWSQAALFFLFGLTQMVQILTLWFTDWKYVIGTCQLLGAQNTPGKANLWHSPEDFKSLAELRAYRWHVTAFRYSLLSVSAKTILEIGFIALVWVRTTMSVSDE